MNTPNPLVPLGTTPARGKSTFFFKVLMILTVHVVLIGGMLLQGCKNTTDTTSNPTPDSSQASATPSGSDSLPPAGNPATVSNAVAQGSAPAVPPTSAPATTQPQPPVTTPAPPPVAVNPPVTAPATETKEYTIMAGDTLGAIAHKNGIGLKALLDANPGVNPKKLQIGKKIEIPAGSGAVASTTGGTAAPDVAASSDDSTVYTVKAGDTLGQIAKAHHTKYKTIMAMNDLKTTSIRVGQKLKLPAPKPAGTETPAASAPASAVVPLQTAPPVSTTAATTPSTASN